MKPKMEIDWPTVLGPLYGGGLDPSEWLSFERAITIRPRRAIRMAACRTIDDLPFAVEPVPWYPAGYFLSAADTRPGGYLHYAVGDYYIQDAGSMLALALCGIQPGQFVCDTCASPGGKSNDILQRLAGKGLLVSNEVIASRQAILGLTLSRAGFDNYLMMNQDVQVLGHHLQGAFDCVIVDAPCTGQSMIARGKQTFAAYSTTQIEHSAARQRRILRAAADLVKPGGKLVYSTCTFSFAENEEMVHQWMCEQSAWRLQRFPSLSAWESPGFEGCYRVWPHRDQCAGGFAAALINGVAADDLRPAAAEHYDVGAARSPRRWNQLQDLPESVDWYDALPVADTNWYQRGQQIHRMPGDCPRAWLELAVGGVPIAELQSGRARPLYGSSVALPGLTTRCHVELSDEQAVSFVAGDSLRLGSTQTADVQSGWCSVTWRGRKLAWGKLTGGVLKNHFPKTLRQANLSV